MTIRFTEGDLLAAADDLGAIAHGCNCAGAMGKGIALPIRNRWPEMYEAYRRLCEEGKFDLGDVFPWRADVVIFNLGTQKTWRSRASLDAVATSVEKMLALAPDLGVTKIGAPRIGAGLGGLDWDVVRARLEEIARPSPIELVVFETYVPAQR